jgi:hypothetical protein
VPAALSTGIAGLDECIAPTLVDVASGDASALRIAPAVKQIGVVSPLLANIYLHRVDRAWQTAGGCWCATPTTLLCCAARKAKPSMP